MIEFLFSPNKSILIFSLPLLSYHFLASPSHYCPLQTRDFELELATDILARMLNLESINAHLCSLLFYLLRSHTSRPSLTYAPMIL